MPPNARLRRFGQHLRALRQRRGLSLKEVEGMSFTISPDSAGTISHPYLSQLESGRDVRISAPKLLTLAAVYAIDVAELLTGAPPAHRRGLLADVAEWLDSGNRPPGAVRYLPAVVDAVNAQIDTALRNTGAGSLISYGAQTASHSDIRNVMLVVLTPPLLAVRSGDRLARQFHSIATEWGIVQARRGERIRPWGGWHAFILEFVRWLVYEQRLWTDALSLVRDWQMVVTGADAIWGGLLKCRWHDDKLNQQFGFDAVEVALGYGARWRHIAMRYFMAVAGKERIPVPPHPIDAVVDLFLLSALGDRFRPDLGEDGRARSLVGCSELLDMIVVREETPSRDREKLRERAAFLKREYESWAGPLPEPDPE